MSALVSNLAQQSVAPLDIGRGFDAFGGSTVDDAEHSPALLRFGHDDFHRIGGGAENSADLGRFENAVLDVDRKTLAQRDDEQVAGADGSGVAGGDGFQLIVVAIDAREASARSLVEGDAKLHLRHGVDD